MSEPTTSRSERDELIAMLDARRYFLRNTLRDLDDEQLRSRSTVSELTLGGLIKHVASTEAVWAQFMVDGPSAFPSFEGEAAIASHLDGFRMLPGESGAGLLAEYAEVADKTNELIRSLPDLEVAHPLPSAPWFPQGARWTRRHAVLHIISETAHHAGHADIIREAIDGAKSMG